MIEYSYDPPYNLWSGNRSDTLNKWKINYKGSIATASALPEKGDFKGDTYNVLEDGSNYMWNGNSWDKLDANVYVGATSTKDGIQGLVPPADSSERSKFLRGDGTYKDVAWSMITDKPACFPACDHTHSKVLKNPASTTWRAGTEKIYNIKPVNNCFYSIMIDEVKGVFEFNLADLDSDEVNEFDIYIYNPNGYAIEFSSDTTILWKNGSVLSGTTMDADHVIAHFVVLPNSVFLLADYSLFINVEEES